MKEEGICFNDDAKQSTAAYVDRFDPLPVYMECNNPGNFLYNET